MLACNFLICVRNCKNSCKTAKKDNIEPESCDQKISKMPHNVSYNIGKSHF